METLGIMYHSGSFYQLARQACERAEKDKMEALGAIVFSVVALEAFLCDFSSHCSCWKSLDTGPVSFGELGKQLQDLESRHVGISVKLRSICLFFEGSYPSRGDSLFQDLDLLVRIRNDIVHNKPTKVRGETLSEAHFKCPPSLQGLLDRKVIQEPDHGKGAPLLQLLATAEVAEWSYATSLSARDRLVASLPGTFGQLIGATALPEMQRKSQKEAIADG